MKVDPTHPFAELFPKREPDPIWNAHADKLDQQIQQLFDSGKLLDAYILAVKGQIEYHSVKRKPGNHCFFYWVTYYKFLKLNEKYPDFKYIYILYRLNCQYPPMEFLTEVLSCLTSMKNNCYTPMSQDTKTEIQKQFYSKVLKDFESPEYYLEIIGEDDVIHCEQNKNNSSIN